MLSAHDGHTVEPILPFLKSLTLPCSILIHFQGYGPATGSAIIHLKRVSWGDGGYPHLDFERPDGMRAIHGSPDFGGAFILAIARVRDDAMPICRRDCTCSVFVDFLKKWS
jgi:hypothetical protein